MDEIIIAPFSNNPIRDWPEKYFGILIGIISQSWQGHIAIIGTKSQHLRACEIVRPHDSVRVKNECGKQSWPDVVGRIKRATCVVGNNSGIAHLSAYHGVPTICIFGGSHQRLEWRPNGNSVTLISRSIGCSPCHLDRSEDCLYDKACLTGIRPEDVASVIMGALRA